MKNDKLDNVINSKDIYGKVFLFYGEEKYNRSIYVNKIKKIYGDLLKGINYIVLDDTNVNNLVFEVNTPAFGYNSKLILINDSNIFKIKKKKTDDSEKEESQTNSSEIDILNLLEKGIADNITIVFNETDVAKTKKIYKLIDKIGIISEFNKLSENDLIFYSITLCKKYGVTMDKSIATYFVSVCNNNMEDIINELRKLIEYTGNGNEVKKEYVDLITTKSIDAVIFDLTDNLGARNVEKSINILDELLLQKEPLQKIYIMLYRHFKNLYIIKKANKQGINNINDELKLHPFMFSKYCKQVSNYSYEEIKKIYMNFMNIDIDNKQGKIDLYTGIINAMCNI